MALDHVLDLPEYGRVPVDIVFGDPATWTGSLDRSPCGTGTCGRMAALHARGQLPLETPFVHEGMLGTTCTGTLTATTRVGPYEAVLPSISGRGWITGFAQYVLDESDPFPHGYVLGDLWGRQAPEPDPDHRPQPVPQEH